MSQNPKRGTATANVQDAPLIDPTKMGGLQSTEGVPATFDLGSLIDTNPGGTASDFTASINWGDGTPASAGSVVANGAGGFDVTGSHTFTSAATRTVTATVNDAGGASTMIVTRIVVHDAPLTARAATGLTAVEGASRALTLGTFTDADPGTAVSDYSATVQWGDGPTSAATVAAVPAGGFSVSASHAYAEEGTWTATVSIVDVGGATRDREPDDRGRRRAADRPLDRTGRRRGQADQRPRGHVHRRRSCRRPGRLRGDNRLGRRVRPERRDDRPEWKRGLHRQRRSLVREGRELPRDRDRRRRRRGHAASAADAIAIASAIKGTVPSTLEWSFDFNTRFTTVTMLAVNGPPAGGVIVKCNGGGCPFRTRTLHVSHGTRRHATGTVSLLNLAGAFRHHKLRPHARITVEITASGPRREVLPVHDPRRDRAHGRHGVPGAGLVAARGRMPVMASAGPRRIA